MTDSGTLKDGPSVSSDMFFVTNTNNNLNALVNKRQKVQIQIHVAKLQQHKFHFIASSLDLMLRYSLGSECSEPPRTFIN